MKLHTLINRSSHEFTWFLEDDNMLWVDHVISLFDNELGYFGQSTNGALYWYMAYIARACVKRTFRVGFNLVLLFKSGKLSTG